MKSDEVLAVAQAITDAHAKVQGMDCEGRMDDARTIIAAVDALEKARAKPAKAVAVVKAVEPEPSDDETGDVAEIAAPKRAKK